MLNFKRPEIYFYTIALALTLTLFNVSPESVSINLGLFTFNNIKILSLQKLLIFGLFVLGVLCVLRNAPYLAEEYAKAISLNKKLNEHVNTVLKCITKNQNNSVTETKLTGWISPEVNTGSWTSYKMAKEAVIVAIPQALAIPVRILALATSILVTSPKLLIPALVAISIPILQLKFL